MTTPPTPIIDEQFAELRRLKAFRNEYHEAQQRRTALVERCERAEYQLVSMRKVLKRVKMAATLPDKEDWDNIDSVLSASADYANKVVVDREELEALETIAVKARPHYKDMLVESALARLDSLRSQGGGE